MSESRSVRRRGCLAVCLLAALPTMSVLGGGGVAHAATSAITPGTVFIADSGNNQVVEIPAGGGAQTTIGSGLDRPFGVAIDAAGDVFIGDEGHDRVVKIPADGGAQTTVGSGLGNLRGVAVDAVGDVFIADSGHSRVVEVPADGGTQTTVGTGLSDPFGVAADAVGDVFIADINLHQVVEVPADGSAQTTVGTGLGLPTGVAVDTAGDVFIADQTNNRVVEVPAGGGTQTTVGTGLKNPTGVAVDAAGDVLIADLSNNRVVKVPADGSAQTTLGTGLNNPTGVVAYAPPPVFTSDSPGENAAVGTPYSYSYAATAAAGDTTTPSYRIESGALPPGLTLNSAKGVLSGTPTTAGSYTFTAETENAANGTLAPPATINVSVPGPPTGLTATAGNTSVSLSWTVPSSTGGSAITGYRVYESTTSGAESDTGTAVCSVTTTSCTVPGLTNGTKYYFVVEAHNSAGHSAASAEVSATPVTVPGAPTAVTATAGNTSVSLSWTVPSSTGGSAITGYKVYESTTSGAESDTGTAVCSVTTTSCTVPGLTNGTKYYFVVEALNNVGHSSPSAEASATPATVPGPPTGVAATAGNASVVLSWTAPTSSGGSAVTGYKVYQATASGGESDTGTAVCSVTTTSCTVTMLTNGTRYYFTVEALNSAGHSAASAEVSATPVTVPGAPTAVTATAGNTSVALSWTAPSSTGGSAVTGYAVFVSTAAGAESVSGAPACTPTGTSCSVSGLTNGTTYRFVVVAVTAVGHSAASAEVGATPVTVPGAPVSVTAVGGAESVTVSWAAPASTGGSGITGYRVFGGPSAMGPSDAGAVLCSTAALSCTLSGLADGASYSFFVETVTGVGHSVASVVATAGTVIRPTATPVGGSTVVAGSRQLIRGSATPGSSVVLSLGTSRIATTTAGKNGAYTLSAVVKKSGTYVIGSDGVSTNVKIKVDTLLFRVSGNSRVGHGLRVLYGFAPAGSTVSLYADGRLVGTVKTARNGVFTFKQRVKSGYHRYGVKAEGVTSKQLKVRAI